MTKKKITITVSEKLYLDLERISDEMGITKNSLCTMYVSQGVYNNNKIQDSLNDVINKMSSVDEFRKFIDVTEKK